MGGASKSYAMTGWRMGYAACPDLIANACDSLQSHSTSNPTSFAQVGFVEALKNGEQDVIKMRKVFEKRRDLIFNLLSAVPKLKPFKAQGAFYSFVDISATKMKSLEFSDRLLAEARVAVVPGVAFGDDRAIRLSFACSEESIQTAVKRISDWMKSL